MQGNPKRSWLPLLFVHEIVTDAIKDESTEGCVKTWTWTGRCEQRSQMIPGCQLSSKRHEFDTEMTESFVLLCVSLSRRTGASER